MARKIKADWCVVNSAKKPVVIECLRCGETMPFAPVLPIRSDKVVARLNGFCMTHSLCEKKEGNV